MKTRASLIDTYKRKINYLRLSVTDRCNLRCLYCMPPEGIKSIPHNRILTYEDMLFLVRTAVSLGVEKVRLTGGEPLVRRGFPDFVRRLHTLAGLHHVVITTNGILLKDYADELRDAGVRSLNVSIDSLDPARFKSITRGGDLRTWWRGIEAAENAGIKLKLNVVVMRGINDAEIEDFADLAQHNPWSVRFIEYMPTCSGPGSDIRGVAAEEVLERVWRRYTLEPLTRRAHAGPAQEFAVRGGRGRIGVISALSCPFCHNCNRIRIGASGKGRSCLFAPDMLDLKPAIRQRSEVALAALLQNLVEQKPEGHELDSRPDLRTPVRMSAIGG